MVKLPLKDKIGSTTIWCTILTEEISGETRKLVIFSPMYVINSELPGDITTVIDITETTKEHLVKGFGNTEQLEVFGAPENKFGGGPSFGGSKPLSDSSVNKDIEKIETLGFDPKLVDLCDGNVDEKSKSGTDMMKISNSSQVLGEIVKDFRHQRHLVVGLKMSTNQTPPIEDDKQHKLTRSVKDLVKDIEKGDKDEISDENKVNNVIVPRKLKRK